MTLSSSSILGYRLLKGKCILDISNQQLLLDIFAFNSINCPMESWSQNLLGGGIKIFVCLMEKVEFQSEQKKGFKSTPILHKFGKLSRKQTKNTNEYCLRV